MSGMMARCAPDRIGPTLAPVRTCTQPRKAIPDAGENLPPCIVCQCRPKPGCFLHSMVARLCAGLHQGLTLPPSEPVRSHGKQPQMPEKIFPLCHASVPSQARLIFARHDGPLCVGPHRGLPDFAVYPLSPAPALASPYIIKRYGPHRSYLFLFYSDCSRDLRRNRPAARLWFCCRRRRVSSR